MQTKEKKKFKSKQMHDHCKKIRVMPPANLLED